MDDEKDEFENEDDESENLEETSEDTALDLRDTQIEKTYQQKLEEYFQALEQKYGLDYANRVRQKYSVSKQFEYWFDSQKFFDQFAQNQLDFFRQCMNQFQLEKNRLAELDAKVNAHLDAQEERNKKLFERQTEILENEEKRSIELDAQIERIGKKVEANAELRRKKLLKSD